MAAAIRDARTEARTPMLKDWVPETPPLVIADRTTIALSFIFWLSVDFMGIYAIIVETQMDGKLDWHLLHDCSVGVLLVLLSLLGVYWEIRSIQLGYLTVSEDVLQFLVYVVCGGYMAAGLWSTSGDTDSEHQAATSYGRFLTVLGFMLGVGRVVIGCFKRQRPSPDADARVDSTSLQPTSAPPAAILNVD